MDAAGAALGLKKYATFQLAALDGRPFVGGRTFSAEDYKRALFLRYGGETARRVEAGAKDLIKASPREVLEDERKFFRYVWLPHRDDPI